MPTITVSENEDKIKNIMDNLGFKNTHNVLNTSIYTHPHVTHNVQVVGTKWSVYHPDIDVKANGDGYSSLGQYLIKYKAHGRN